MGRAGATPSAGSAAVLEGVERRGDAPLDLEAHLPRRFDGLREGQRELRGPAAFDDAQCATSARTAGRGSRRTAAGDEHEASTRCFHAPNLKTQGPASCLEGGDSPPAPVFVGAVSP